MQIRNGADVIRSREGRTIQRGASHQSGRSNLGHAQLILLIQNRHRNLGDFLTHVNVALQHTNDIHGGTSRIHLGGNGDSLGSSTIQEGHIAHVRITLSNGQTLGLNLIGQRITNVNSVHISKHADSVGISLGHNAEQSLGENSVVDAFESGVVKSVQDMTGLCNLRDTSLGTTVGQDSLTGLVILLRIHVGVHRKLHGQTSRTIVTGHSSHANLSQVVDDNLGIGIARNPGKITKFVHYVLSPF